MPTGVAVARTGMETQGTSLQGARPDIETQGTGLQGARPGEQDQGTSLQGAPPEIPIQGTSLQGAPPDVPVQGTSLQGGPPEIPLQGTSLQGASPEVPVQGTSLQGVPPEVPLQGTSLQGAPPEMPIQGTSLQGGRARRSYRGLGDLNGARLRLASGAGAVSLRDGEMVAPGFDDSAALEGIELEATAPDGRLFRVEVTRATLDGRTRLVELAADGLPVCEPGQAGVIVTGRWDATGAHVDDPDVVTFSCASGVIAKCVTWGYAPWVVGPDVHAACTRMARADYCGDGTPWTMDGTHIGVFDTLGVRARLAAGTMVFEAAWSPAGAVCIARTRYEIHEGSDRLEPACVADLPTCAGLDDPTAGGAVLANDSNVSPIAACE
ncbi:MAG TPA: ADYC domain-containing protein [Kofleriaceae bacterium]|nr:ADYC domain-containing protein [Kofleriaceae bacterium]